jgi:type II secretory ATPase GspE/PulE/Tfp pilus assembly ATPase PilB-like protein
MLRGTKGLEKQLELETRLRQLTNKIHAQDLDEMFATIKADLQKLISAERVTLFVKDGFRDEIYSKFKDGDEIKQIRLPVGANSIAGFVAKTQQGLRVSDVYDADQLAMVSPDLKFDRSWDEKSGFRTKSVLAVPINAGGKLHGVLQLVNKKNDQHFTDQDGAVCQDLAEALGIAIQNQKRLTVRRSKYDMLIVNDRIDDERMESCRKISREKDCSFEWAMMQTFKIPKDEILQSLAGFYRCEPLTFSDRVVIPAGLLEPFTVDYLKHHKAVPMEESNGAVVVLMEDPRDIVTRDDISLRLGGKKLSVKVGIREDIIEFIDYFYGQRTGDGGGAGSTSPEDIKDIMKDLEAEGGEDAAGKKEEEEEEEAKEDDSGIVRLVNQIIEQAHSLGASDIHVEPYPESDMIIRFRVDGVCREYTKVPRKWSRAMASRIKVMSGLDIAERRLPQDGKIKFKNYGRRDIELRVATLPTQGGLEDVVMRILAASKPIPIDEIGMRPTNLEKFKAIVDAPYGIMLCVGPTGSGKTTTLHSAVGFINRPEYKIWTAEDPVEITQYGIRQVQIHHKIGLTFEKALRAFLRADPDVIMVGEMRDFETASAGIEASLTGHLVFSTLHTNNAPDTITRLLDMGLDPFSFGDSLLAILAQRLCRTLCKKCKKEGPATKEEIQAIEKEFGDPKAWERLEVKDPAKLKLFKAAGCDVCNGTGYKGRMGVHELLVVNEEIRLMIYAKAKASDIRQAAFREGMWTLKQDGIKKVLEGKSDLREVRSVASG